MALVVAQEVPTSSTMAVPHGPSGVRLARRRMREELLACGAPDTVVDDAILILSELLSNACRHARPLHEGPSVTHGAGGAHRADGPEGPSGGTAADTVRASWCRDAGGEVTIAVTDGGGPTRPLPAKPSVTARGGRGLAIITALARDWGVRSEHPDGSPRTGLGPPRTAPDGTAAADTAHGRSARGRASRARTSSGSSGAGARGPCVPDGSTPGVPADGEPAVTVWAVLRPDNSFSGRVAASLNGLGAGSGGLGGGEPGEEFDLASVEEL
ncbi:ATP-binding protein [Streptomyces reniochalinae]|uniref:ATP-binding protein n=1 Tax=Streptomyces reniochalinae TaxID=2250578 RepID=A0A367EFZ5_9ACTN|nr:ATP-binding protein [Streptomyces reniochalinae]